MIALVDADRGDLGRSESGADEHHRVIRPRDDVDLLALEFLDHVLNANPLHADASADRIHVTILRDDGDLGASARFAGAELDLDDLFADFRNFDFEQLHQIFRRSAGQIKLRAASA